MAENKASPQAFSDSNMGNTTALNDHAPFTLRSSHMAPYIATMSPEERDAFEVEMAQIEARAHYQKIRIERQVGPVRRHTRPNATSYRVEQTTEHFQVTSGSTIMRPGLQDPSKSSPDLQEKLLIPNAQVAEALQTPSSRLQNLTSKMLQNEHQRALVSQLPESSAQLMVDYLDIVSRDIKKFGTRTRKAALDLLFGLVKSARVLPKSYQLKDVEYERNQLQGVANIYKGKYKDQAVCLKVLRVQRQDNVPTFQTLAAEVVLWAHLAHSNVLPLYGTFLLGNTPPRLCLVSPWMVQGNIHDYITRSPNSPRMVFISDILNGLKYLHDMRIVHGDLKATNILISDDRRALITDLGLSSIAETLQLESDTRVGVTSSWMAPELLAGGQATRYCDIWSFACLCYEILASKKPFYQYTTGASLTSAMLRKEIPLRPAPSDGSGYEKINDQMWNLLVTCWTYIPEYRPSCFSLQFDIERMKIQDDRREVTMGGGLSTVFESRRETSYARVDHALVDEILLGLSSMRKTSRNILGAAERISTFRSRRGARIETNDYLSENLDQKRPTSSVAESTRTIRAQLENLPADIGAINYKNLDGRVQRLIGSMGSHLHGGLADVYTGHLTDDSNRRHRKVKTAIKVLRPPKDMDKIEWIRKDLFRETVVWQGLDHPNILPFFGLAHDQGRLECPALITPYCENGTVRDYLPSHPEVNTRLFIVKGVSEGLRYLHEQGVVHGDVKPNNILISADGHPLLCDFGLLSILIDCEFTTISQGAYRYQAPELRPGTGPNKATDVYAFALSSYEIWTGLQPYHDISSDASLFFSVISRDTKPEYPDPAPPGTYSLWKILENCWKTKPEERLEIEQVVQELVTVSTS